MRNIITSYLLPGVLALPLLVCAPALAQRPSEASRLIERGVDMRERGDHLAALALFERAASLEPTPRATAQIGLAHHALGHYLVAREKLVEALSQPRDNWIRTRRAALEEGVRDCESHLARISVEGGAPGDLVFVDGEERAQLPLSEPIFADPGTAMLTLRRNDAVIGSSQALLSANTETLVRFEVSLAPAPAASEPVEPAATVAPTRAPAASLGGSPSSSNWRVPVGWTAVGLGAAGLATGIAFQVMRENAASEYNSDDCGGRDDAACESYRSSHDAPYRTAAIAGYVAGGVFVAAGITLLLLPEPEHSTTAARISCAPFVGTSTGLACDGAF